MHRSLSLFVAATIAITGCSNSESTQSNDSKQAASTSKQSILQEAPDAEPGRKQLVSQRAYPVGRIDLAAVKLARLQVAQMRQRPNSGITPQWVQRGPLNVQGRITAIAVDQNDDDVAYIGAASGGVFRTMDGGNSFTSVFDHSSALSIGAVALDPSDQNVVYVGTGEVNPGGGSMAYGGNGLWRSDDQGNTWTNIGLADSGSIGRIVVHPTNSNIIHVAVMGHIWNPSSNRGVYRTTDGGASWSKVLYVDDTTGCVDLVQRPDDPNVLLASMWTRIREPEVWVYGGINCAVYRSDDGGLNWSLEGNGLPAPSAEIGRIGLSICQANPDVMVAIYSHAASEGFAGLYRTTNDGATWARTNDSDLSGSFATYGWWFGNVAIHPENEDIIYTVGFDDYISTDGGNSHALIPGMHVDHHDLAFGSGPTPKIYAGNDGGVYTSTDGVTFTKTTGDLPITQVYRIAISEVDTEAILVGTQDNGTKGDFDGDGNFGHVWGGDGFEPVIQASVSNKFWVQSQYGSVWYTSNGGTSFSNALDGLSGRRNWNAPHAIDPIDRDTRYFGFDSVFRNDGNTAWTRISGDLTGGPHLGNSGQVDGTLTTINVSRGDSGVIWSGSDDGYVHVTTDGGANWTNVSAGLPQRWITSVRPHPSEPAEALVSVSGFRWGETVSHIYRTTDSGQNWTGVDGNLPDMPVNDVMYDRNNPNRYFAATDIGVFQSFDAGASWNPMGTGMPAVVVNDFAYQHSTRKLFAGTYGRSVYEITIPELWTQSLTVTTGNLVAGTVTDLATSDNVDVSVRRGNTVQSIVTLELKSTSHVETPSELQFTFEASVFSRGVVTQTISLFNYDSDEFEEVDVRPASRLVDQTVAILPAGDVSRFVQPGTGCVEARIHYQGSANRQQFAANIDQAFWKVSD